MRIHIIKKILLAGVVGLAVLMFGFAGTGAATPDPGANDPHYTVILRKGQKIGSWMHISTLERATCTNILKIKIGEGKTEDCAQDWEYTATNDNTALKFFDAVTDSSGNFIRWGWVPRAPEINQILGDSFSPRLGSLKMTFEDAYPPDNPNFNGLFDGLVVAFNTESPYPKIVLHAFNGPCRMAEEGASSRQEESIALFENPKDPNSSAIIKGYWANYPEVSFVTFLAFIWDLDGTIRLYDGDDPIRINIKLKKGYGDYVDKELPFQLVNLTKNGLRLSNLDVSLAHKDSNLRAVDWRGLFLALAEGPNGESPSSDTLKEALARTSTESGRSGLDNDLQVLFDKDNRGVCVIAIKSWNYNKEVNKLIFELGNQVQGNADLRIGQMYVNNIENAKEIPVTLNFDKTSFVREGESGNPGRFVVEGTIDPGTKKGRPYSEIIEILVGTAEAGAVLPNDGQVDWLQVAAADICNSSDNEILKSVWKIQAGPCEISASREVRSLGWQNHIRLNPFWSDVRFNDRTYDVLGFSAYEARDALVYHEAGHSCAEYYLSLEKFKDEDRDGLLLTENNAEPPPFKYCFDHFSKGYFAIKGTGDYLERCLSGMRNGWGDLSWCKHNWRRLRFVRRIQNIEWIKKIFSGELKNPNPPPDSIHTNLLDIVQDLPKEILDTKSYRIFLRNPVTRKSRELLDAENFSDFQISDRKQVYSHGEYNPAYFNFLTFGSQYDRNEAYLQLIDKEGYEELYLVVNLSIKVIEEDSLPDKYREYYQSHLGAEELDCGSFGIIQ